MDNIPNPVPTLPPLGNTVTYAKPDGAQFIIALVDDDYDGGMAQDNSGATAKANFVNDYFFNPDETPGALRDDDDEDEDEDDDEWLCWDTTKIG